MRACTQHPIYSFVSYDGLSPRYQASDNNLSHVEIPQSIHDALGK